MFGETICIWPGEKGRVAFLRRLCGVGLYESVGLSSRGPARLLAALASGHLTGIVWKQQRAAEWDSDVRKSSALSVCVVLYVCKGHGKLGQSCDYSFPKMSHFLFSFLKK